MPLTPDDERFMRQAIDACRRGVEAGQSPFGACIVLDGRSLVATHNHVWHHTDPTGHAEVQAIRAACADLGTVHLDGATIYSTTEPCPMCFSAIHWTRISRIVYGASIADAARFGFNELPISNAQMRQAGGSDVVIDSPCLRDEALAVFEAWRDRGGRSY